MEDSDWERLIDQLGRGDCTPFLGAGACVGTLPDASALSRRWARQYDYPFQDHHDLARVMQYISISRGDPIYIKEKVCDDFDRVDPPPFNDPCEPHALLAKFPIRVFITTNYDDFLAKALSWAGKAPKAAICPWYLPASADFARFFARSSVPADRPVANEPLVFHLHGNHKTAKSIVLTEADYLEFLANIVFLHSEEETRLIPSVVLGALTDYPLLFIGYSLQDWTFRVIFHGLLRTQSEVLRRRSISVQLPPPINGSIKEAERRAQDYIARYLEGWSISIYWGTAAEFCDELRIRMGPPA